MRRPLSLEAVELAQLEVLEEFEGKGCAMQPEAADEDFGVSQLCL